MTSRNLFLACALACAGAQALLYLLAGVFSMAVVAVVAGLLWTLADLFPDRKSLAVLRQGWVSNLVFIALGLLSIGVLWIGRPWPAAVLVLMLALAAWDLYAFRMRVYPAEQVGGATILRAYYTGREVAHSQPISPAAQQAQAESEEQSAARPDQSEQAAFERAHLRAVGLVMLLCALLSLGLYFLAGWIVISGGLVVGLGLTVALGLGLILLARLVLR